MKKNHLQQYLQEHAEVDAVAVAMSIPQQLRFDHCLVIPSYDENLHFLRELRQSPLAKKKLLLVVVINQPNNIPHTCLNNQKLWQDIRTSGKTIVSSTRFQLIQWVETQAYVLALNRFKTGQAIPHKQGVGLARKIGCDLACQLLAKQQLTSQWVHTTDADTTLPNDYFEQIPAGDHCSAICYPFKHYGDNNPTTHATWLYEQSLHHYVKGLQAAGSPYAHHSLGSCIAVHAIYYAQARGFPKRAGGEDFYLLNKLAKLGKIQQNHSEPLRIKARESQRAPFGTGIAVGKITAQQKHSLSIKVYNPLVFMELKKLLSHFQRLCDVSKDFDHWLTLNSPEAQSALKQMGIQKLFSHLQHQGLNREQAYTHINHWFDGFRTLKFIHQLETFYPKQIIEYRV